MNLRRLFLSFLLPLLALSALAQRTVTGVVRDSASKTPLASVTILVKGTGTGTQTASDGTFTINVPANASTLVISSVGYGTQEVIIGNGPINVSLGQASTTLSDVVVIGYGTAKRKDLTGSIATVSEKDFQKGTITSADQLIAGKVAGVQVISNGGAPGAGSTIRIRGGASLNASNDPLFVIDGIPLTGDALSGVANPMAMINPDDIESFTILKDAASTAIYGSRASNGVILITTKKGRKGQTKINFSTVASLGTIAKELRVLNADEMRAFVNNAPNNEDYVSLLGNANTDWQKEIYQTADGRNRSLDSDRSKVACRRYCPESLSPPEFP